MKLLLDTSAYSALMRGHSDVAARVRSAEGVYLSSIVAGELLYGFRHGTRYLQNRSQLESFIASPVVHFLPVSLTTADRFGIISANLRRQGTPLPSNDIWIAAHTLETGADLLSFDHHFTKVAGLSFIFMGQHGVDP
ncbi:MAG TPA: type II toxin-antitoxin system VapC family toxin [Kiritimatiellia bacterium]|nr:type II toxin-antitoxin system VapC family toxin [Kiritimatiellia bacterium]